MFVKPRVFNRILSAVTNFMFLLLVTFSFDALCSSKVMRATTDYNEIKEKYNNELTEFASLQDKYEIYIIDPVTGKRIFNTNVSEENKQAFLNDERVKELTADGDILSKKLLTYSVVSIVISYGISILLVYYLPPLFFKKKHFNIGNKLFNIVYLYKSELVKKGRYYYYASMYVLFHLLIGVCTFFVFNLIDIITTSIGTKQTSLLERMFGYELAIDPDKIEAEKMSDEKIYEINHAHDNK